MPYPTFVELPAADLDAARMFYADAFGWVFSAYGPTYASATTGPTDVGLQGDAAEAPRAPLPVIEVEELERALKAVSRAGGTVSRPIFGFPSGRRFHFKDPNGNELAVWQRA